MAISVPGTSLTSVSESSRMKPFFVFDRPVVLFSCGMAQSTASRWRKQSSRLTLRCVSRLRYEARATQVARFVAEVWPCKITRPSGCSNYSDFQVFPRSMSDRVFARLKSEQGVERAQVIFTFSHNHCGPRLGDDLIDYYPWKLSRRSLSPSIPTAWSS